MARAVMNELTVVPFVGVSRIISFIPRSLSLSPTLSADHLATVTIGSSGIITHPGHH